MGFKQKIEEQFQKISESMIASNEIGRCTTQHGVMKGRNTEQVLINFLRKFLPSRYSLSQGQIVSPTGKLSPQLDVIIHDETIYPVATVLEGGDKIVFAHSVYAVVSVKSNLFEIQGKSQIRNMIQNLEGLFEIQKETNQAISNLRKEVDIFYFGFVFYNEEQNIERKLNDASLEAKEFLSAVAILKSGDENTQGFYINPALCVHKRQEKQLIFQPKEKNTLLAFYRTLFNRLCEKDIVELGELSETKRIIKCYKPWGEWGY